ncbi:MAG: dienelactone hydrolase family protein [Acidobacteriota bacterium]
MRQTRFVDRESRIPKRNDGHDLTTSRLLGGMLVSLALLVTAVAQSGQPSVTEPFSPPTGPFAVGTHEYLWIDQTRGEPFTKDPADRRRLLARVWYPAEKAPGKETAWYVLDASEFPEKSLYRQGVTVKTNSVTDAPLASGKSRFPVLIYQPGGGTARFIGTFQAEQFASQGYVVIGADHPGFSETIRFPDGSQFKADMLLAPKETGNFRDDVLKNWDWLNDEVFPTWIADASYTLDKIAELDRTPGQLFYKRLDLSRIGMMGWSFGGATAMQMSRNDPRVKAVVDQDGQLFGDVRDKGTSRPFMLIHHGLEDKPPKPEQTDVMKEMTAKTKAWDRSLIDHSTNEWYEVTIAKTQHGHFSDFLLFFRRNPTELDPHRAHEIITAYTLAFFDKYLRGQSSDLLKAPSDRYPEVTFKKGKGHIQRGSGVPTPR